MMRATTRGRLVGLLLCTSPSLLTAASSPTPTSLEELAECRQAVERVLWERSLWPEENPGAKPEFDALVSLEDIALRMQDVLLRADALGKRWHQPVDQAALEQELQRMRRTSQDRALLAALIEAAGSRPRAALCVAMPDFVLRELNAAYANDLKIHGARRGEIERHFEQGLAYPAALGPDVAVHSERVERYPNAHHDTAGGLPAAAWQSVLARFDIPPDEPDTGSEVGKAARAKLGAYIGARTGLLERRGDFALQEITAADDDSLTIRTTVWAKQPLHAWWSRARAEFYPHVPRFESKASTVVENTDVLPDPLLPGARYGQAAVWTGTEMIIWGGHDGVAPVADGYRYTPASNSWVPLADFNAPTARWLPSVVWTGLDVIIWGGASTTGGGVTPSDHKRYRSTADQWDTLTAAPISSRYHHAAVWTGSRMIIWGGIENGFGVAASGALYNPADNSWQAMIAPSPPSARFRAVAVWTGNEMVVWGGEAGGGVHLHDGARFTPGVPGAWAPINAAGAPSARSLHTAVWTGPPLNRMLVWGGKFASASALADGALYDPSGNAWTTMAAGGPAARYFQTAVWTGSEMIVWGGTPDNVEWLSSGARYAPASNSWTGPTALVDAPAGRYIHTAVWSSDRMIVWGGRGEGGKPFHTGGRYSVLTDSWQGTGAYTSCEAIFGNLVPNCGAEQGGSSEGWTSTQFADGSVAERDAVTSRGGSRSHLAFNTHPGPRAAEIYSPCFPVAPNIEHDFGLHVLVRSEEPVTCFLGRVLSGSPNCSTPTSSRGLVQHTINVPRWRRIAAKVRPSGSEVAAKIWASCYSMTSDSPEFTVHVDDAYVIVSPPGIFRDGFEPD